VKLIVHDTLRASLEDLRPWTNKGSAGEFGDVMRWYREAAVLRFVGDSRASVRWFRKAADLHMNQDYGRALTCYRKAADLNQPDAMRGIGDLYFLGKGVPRDFVKARLWYRKAAGLGAWSTRHPAGQVREAEFGYPRLSGTRTGCAECRDTQLGNV
jgi:TPR repeat protein